MEALAGWAGLILGFSGLIFVHELGHFLLAKWNGVRVHVFSIGMGPYIVSFTHNGTVYALSLIPLGGYVKMMGQDDLNADLSADKNPEDFRNKRPGQKAQILVAGAAFNILLTLVLFTGCYLAGTPFEPPIIGNIAPNTALAKAVLDSDKTVPAKLKKGDRITFVNTVPVKSYFDLMMQITACPIGQPITLAVQRIDSGRGLDYVHVEMEEDKRNGIPNIGLNPGEVFKEEEVLPLGFATDYLILIGKDPAAEKESKDGAAAKTGKFKKGDRILAVEDRTKPGHPVIYPMDSEFALTNVAAGSRSSDPKQKTGEPRIFIIERDGQRIEIPVSSELDEKSTPRFGLSYGPYKRVTQIDETSEAYKAGLRRGDYVLGFQPDVPTVHPWKTGKLVWVKEIEDKKPSELAVTIPEVNGNNSHDAFRQSFVPMETVQKTGAIDALGTSWDDTKNYTVCMFSTLRNLIVGHVSAKNLSGPLGIGGTIFTVASKQSFAKYIWWLAFISLNLGVMQLLPIPLLDGFHLVIVAAEKIKGSAVNPKIQEAFLYAGLAMIGSLMIYAMWNDIVRFLPGQH